MAQTPSTMRSLGSPAPDFTLEDAAGGGTVSRGDFAGRPLLVIISGAHRADLFKLAALTDSRNVTRADPGFVRMHTGQPTDLLLAAYLASCAARRHGGPRRMTDQPTNNICRPGDSARRTAGCNAAGAGSADEGSPPPLLGTRYQA